MIFLIEYDRSQGSIVTFRQYDDARRREAEDARLQIELDLNQQGVNHEVVLLEADSEDALHRTHQRYFENFSRILEDWIKGQELMQSSRHPSAGG
jgi:hypothetical protein